jgi:hypothetical protein
MGERCAGVRVLRRYGHHTTQVNCARIDDSFSESHHVIGSLHSTASRIVREVQFDKTCYSIF